MRAWQIEIWWRKPYCPILDSLANYPDDWETGTARLIRETALGQARHVRHHYASLFHKETKVEVTYHDYISRISEVKRNGKTLPICSRDLKKAIAKREAYAERKQVEEVQSELNKITQDFHTYNMNKLIKMRKELADAEALHIQGLTK